MKMDLTRIIVVLGILISELALISNGTMVFPVQHKFKDHPSPFREMRDHNAARLRRKNLAVADFGLGGFLEKTWLYYTKLKIGTPPEEYILQIDTGSSIPWLICHADKSSLNKTDDIPIKLYDPKESSTSRLARCKKDRCMDYTNYGDGSKFSGFYVWDVLRFDRITRDFDTVETSTLVKFGCGKRNAGEAAPSSSVGILGLSQSQMSLVSQLAMNGYTRPSFAHCLDRSKGGGIFAIGEVVEPKVKTAPLVFPDENEMHYVILMTGFKVGGEYIDIPSLKVDGGKPAKIDSGASMTVLPKEFYEPLLQKIFAQQPQLKYSNNSIITDTYCFDGFKGNVDDVFPTVTFQFEGGLTLTVAAHDYILPQENDNWCISWARSDVVVGPEEKDLILIGDEALTNRFVVYNLEDRTVGWTKYDCTSSIKVRDRLSGAVYSVGAHNLSH
ncbi:hypothetical protein L6164_036421 [Bauhinia variegata]|uniref:Uncharacterized protein n=1 Tax=Bauhinia variegata TaxID=167791 RepID=A0ACB9KH48_BAUVA|nr:hypothetical protein L6164_036421 [Bauhinia variegata]